MQTPDWVARGQPHIWQPYAQMKTATPPLPVVRSHGSRLELADGRQLIDGVASWWTACHGYNHPHIAQAVRAQLDAMPHVMFGGLTHEPALTLARRLAALLGPGLDRVFYTDSGSVAVEVAMKMAVQFWLNQGERGRSRFLAFRGGYHGDTFGTMAVCDPDEGMHSLFRGMLAEHDIVDLPRDDAAMARLDAFLETRGPQLAGILVEPLVQGAGGMLLHDPEVLRRLRRLADRHGLLLIFDEIFTGFGRTGTLFAFEQAGIRPDIITLSKSLSGFGLPMSLVLMKPELDVWKPGAHSGTFRGNNLAFVTATQALETYWTNTAFTAEIQRKERVVRDWLENLVHSYPNAGLSVRGRGLIQGLVSNATPALSNRIAANAFKRGVVIETSGAHDEVLKLLPALTIEEELLSKGLEVIEASVADALAEEGQSARILKFGGKRQ